MVFLILLFLLWLKLLILLLVWLLVLLNFCLFLLFLFFHISFLWDIEWCLKYVLLGLMFKIHNSISSIYLNNLIKKSPKSGLRSLSFNCSFRFSVKHSFAKRSFSYSGSFLWNSLPSSLIATKSLMVFRRGLKAYLFNKFMAERFCSPRKRRYIKIEWLIDEYLLCNIVFQF